MSSRKSALLFAHTPVATLVLNREGQVVDANPESLRTLSETKEKIVGAPILALVTQEDRPRARENFMAVLSGKAKEWSSRCRRGDGVTRVFHLKAVPLTGDGSEVRGVVLFVMDISQDQAGRPERNQMQSLIENLPGQFLLTLDDSGRVRYASGLSRTHYRSEVDAVGIPYGDLLEEGDENAMRARDMLRAVASGGDWAGTHWHARADGTVFPVRIFASPHREPKTGKVLGGLVVGREVSVEYDLRHRAERVERLATIGEMVGALGERMQGIIRRVATTMKPLLSFANGQAAQLTADLAALDRWSDAILDLASDVPLNRQSVRVGDMARSMLEVRRARIDQLDVQVSVDGEATRSVSIDPDRSGKAILAVLDNALDALADRPGGRTLRMVLQEGQEGVILKLVDNGPGIPRDIGETVFEPFHTGRDGRPGLGLTRARDQLKSQGGRIWYTSNGGGTTVSLEFPYEAPEASFPFRPIPLTLNRQKSILVVDDEDAVRTGIRKFLEKVGYDVREAWSGRSALAQLTAGQPPELVLTDLKMTDGSGYWFLDQLARDFPALLERTLVLTGDTEHAEVTEVAQRTGVPVLRKPLELPDLLERLDEVARR